MPLDKLDPNVTADLLKLYLLELPEPLVPYESYNKLLGSRNEGTRSAHLLPLTLALDISVPDLKKLVAAFPQVNLVRLTHSNVI